MLLKKERGIPCLGLFGKGVLLKGVLHENIQGFFPDIKATSAQHQMKNQTGPSSLLLRTGNFHDLCFCPELTFLYSQQTEDEILEKKMLWNEKETISNLKPSEPFK